MTTGWFEGGEGGSTGYSIYSRTIITAIEVTGSFWGICGLIGAYNCHWHFVRLYNIYQWGRLFAGIAMYIIDFPLLWYCELWVSDNVAAHEKMGWNPRIYKVAMHGDCLQERTEFMFGSLLSLAFLYYCASANSRYQDQLAGEIPFLIKLDKDAPKGHFFSQSLGERSFLLPNPNLRAQEV